MVGDAQDLIKNLVHGRFKRTLCMGGAIFRGCMGVSPASPLAHVWGQRECNGGVGIASAPASFLFFPVSEVWESMECAWPICAIGRNSSGRMCGGEEEEKVQNSATQPNS